MSIIFTNHAQARLRQRKMARSDIERVLSKPDHTAPGKKSGTTKFVRMLSGRRHEVIARFLKDKNKWLILSVWVRGEADRNWVFELCLAIWKVLKFLFLTIIRVLRK